MRLLLFLALLATSIFACKKQGPIPVEALIEDPFNKEYPGVVKEFWPHFESFEREANLRDISLDLQAEKITGRITDVIGAESVAGACYHNENKPNEIRIDSLNWAKSTTLGQEFFVFHELGHCVLLQDHRNDATAKGYCKSIMYGPDAVCINRYSKETRSRFLDELFFH